MKHTKHKHIFETQYLHVSHIRIQGIFMEFNLIITQTYFT